MIFDFRFWDDIDKYLKTSNVFSIFGHEMKIQTVGKL